MPPDVVRDVRTFLIEHGVAVPFSPATPDEVKDAQSQLGGALPRVVSRLLTEIGNGGFGPGYGLIGVGQAGHHSDYGHMVSTYIQLRRGSGECEDAWPDRLVPFCEFGCNTSLALLSMMSPWCEYQRNLRS